MNEAEKTPRSHAIFEAAEYPPRGVAFNEMYVLACTLERENTTLRARCEAAEKALRRIEQALLPDPHDERDISVDWLRAEIRAAIDAAARPNAKDQP